MTNEATTDQTSLSGAPEAPPEGLIDTDYTVGQDNIEGNVGPFGFDVHNPVFLISALAVVAFVVFTIALPDLAGSVCAT